MHETCALWLLVPSVTIHLYNDQYTVRLSELTETTVSTVMGTTNLEGSMRAALATAELDDADLRQIYDELKSIKTDALDPAGRLAMAITRSQTETSMRYALATAELDEADHHGLLHELLISAHLSASQRISAHLSASQRISAHLSASQRISAHLSASRRHHDRGSIKIVAASTTCRARRSRYTGRLLQVAQSQIDGSRQGGCCK
jgi:hypothetical protein